MNRVLATLVVALAALTPAAPAAAHEGGGTISVAARTPDGGGAIGFEVAVAFEDDGHPAGEATVTAVVEQAGAPPSTPVPLAPTGVAGRYAGQARFPSPGRWTVRFTSVSPVASLGTSELVEAGAAPAAGGLPVVPSPTDPAVALANRDRSAGNTPLLGLLLGAVGVGVLALLMVRSSRGPRTRGPSTSARRHP